MPSELRRLLNRTQAVEVSVRYDQVEELIGEDKAYQLALSLSSMNQKPHKDRRGQRVRSSSHGLATYNRKELIDAIDEAATPKPTYKPATLFPQEEN